MWWTGKSKTSQLVSLEAGWVVCENWSTKGTTLSVFPFSTPDDYQEVCSQEFLDNCYNTQGGFVQYSGVNIVGVPANEISTDLRWQKAAGAGGDQDHFAELEAIPYTISVNDTLVFGDGYAIGFYLQSQYRNGVQSLDRFSTGLELYVGTQTGFTAGGRIEDSYVDQGTIADVEYTSSPMKEGWIAVAGTHAVGYEWSLFSGEYKPLPCISDLSKPC